MEDQDRLRNAKRQVARLKGFYIHLTVFVLVMIGLTAINVYLGQPYWVLWVLLGWGIGLIGHAIGVFGRRVPLSKQQPR
jgi:hypothetical protein